jgi:hypothetical protein
MYTSYNLNTSGASLQNFLGRGHAEHLSADFGGGLSTLWMQIMLMIIEPNVLIPATLYF